MATGAFADGDRSMSVGRVFARAFAAIGGNPVTMFGVAFLFSALPSMIWTLVAPQRSAPADFAAGPTVANIAPSAALGLVYFVFALAAHGGIVRATAAHGAGQRAGLGEAAARGLTVALPLLGLTILLGLGVMLASILFLVPGIMLAIMWSVAAPARVEERCGVFGAFGRSRYLTKGARWKIFGLGLVVFVFYLIVVAIVGILAFATFGLNGLAARAQQGASMGSLLVNAVVQTLVTTIGAAIPASLYVELRDWKDGPAADRLAEIFA